MFLHVLSDALGSVGVIVSSLLIQAFGWNWSDPLCSIFIAVLTGFSIWPLLKSSTETLLQRCPRSLDNQLSVILNEISSIHGVLGYSNPHVWELDHENYVATIKIQVHHDVDTNFVIRTVTSIFGQRKVHNVTIQVEKDLVKTY